MTQLWLDEETYNERSLKAGTYKYAETAEITLLAWGPDDEPIDVWDVYHGEPMPVMLRELLEDPEVEIISHESFDRIILRSLIARGEIDLPAHVGDPGRWQDTAAMARAHSMPGKLSKLCSILQVPTGLSKMPEGEKLVQLFCKPTAKRQGGKRNLPEDFPDEWEMFKDYCVLDVISMREVRRRMPKWNWTGNGGQGLRRWRLDQRINDRGFAVDRQLATEAVAAVKRVRAHLNYKTERETGYAVSKATQRDKLIEHLLEEWGVSLPDLKADTIERRLQDENLPGVVKELLQIRQQASTASVAKYEALLRSATEDDRIHGALLFCGAARTGRRSHRLFQPGNLSRVPKHLIKVYDDTAEIIRSGNADLLLDNPMETMGNMVRACIVAPPGKKLCVADLSNIEGRMMAWGAGETWKLDAFREYDAGIGHDLYILAYARSFRIDASAVLLDYEEGGIMRQIGKVQELALQYWGGKNAFKKMAAIYGVELDDARVKEIVQAWRAANKATMDFSGNLEKAARKAIKNPGLLVRVGHSAAFQRDGAWLRMRLPSGRVLCYPHPQVSADEDEIISYMGINAYTRKWERISTYGGKLGENWTQAASADVMMEAEEEIELADYPIVLDVHDEVVAETPDDPMWSGSELAALLAARRKWCPGIPLAAKGGETYRYRKD